MKDKKEIELIRYILVGGFTTLVNYVVYFGLSFWIGSFLIRNSIAWMAAVLFSYEMNRKYVFESKKNSLIQWMEFVVLRFITLLIENGMLFLFIDCFSMNEWFSKIFISVLTVLGNYIFCKWKIFTKEEIYNG